MAFLETLRRNELSGQSAKRTSGYIMNGYSYPVQQSLLPLNVQLKIIRHWFPSYSGCNDYPLLFIPIIDQTAMISQ